VIVRADSLRGFPLGDAVVDCVVTSPPYWGLRDYGVAGQLGQETAPEDYVTKMVAVFREVWRVLKPGGTVWLNLGDTYASGNQSTHMPGETGKHGYRFDVHGPVKQANRRRLPGLKPKNLIGIPWRVAFALQADGWWLRSDIVWAKRNPMPESVQDRPTRAHEFIFLLTKSERYWYDAAAIREAGTGVAHDTTTALIRPCILAGCPVGGVVLDPFVGTGTTVSVAEAYGRLGIGFDLNGDYLEMARARLVGGRQLNLEELTMENAV